MLKKLISIANKLDQKGFYQEADLLTKMASIMVSRSNLFKALKNNDVEAARKALVGMSGDDLGLTHGEFRDLTSAIMDKPMAGISGIDRKMDFARYLLDIEENISHPKPLPKKDEYFKSYKELGQKPKIGDAVVPVSNRKSDIKEDSSFIGIIQKIDPAGPGTVEIARNGGLDIDEYYIQDWGPYDQ